MEIQPVSLADALGGVLAFAMIIGGCLWMWRLTWAAFPAFSREHFWRVIYWSHGIGFFIGLTAFFTYVGFSYLALAPSAVEVSRPAAHCFAAAAFFSLFIGMLIVIIHNEERKKGDARNKWRRTKTVNDSMEFASELNLEDKKP